MKYLAIALDLDGTLLNSQKEVSKGNKEAILKAAETGVQIILASGRPIPGMRKIAHALKLDEIGGYCLSYNGGMIVDCQTDEVLRRETVSPEYYETIVKTAHKYGVTPLTYDSEGIITDNPDHEYVQLEAKINNIPVKKVFHLHEVAAQDPPVKFLMVGDHKTLLKAQADLIEKIGDAVEVFFSEPYFMEITPKGIEKATSLEYLLSRLEIDRKHLIACGDGFNDIPMMRYAGLAVAMKNAQPETKEWADVIAPLNDEDGVAQIIEKYILEK